MVVYPEKKPELNGFPSESSQVEKVGDAPVFLAKPTTIEFAVNPFLKITPEGCVAPVIAIITLWPIVLTAGVPIIVSFAGFWVQLQLEGPEDLDVPSAYASEVK